MPGYFSEFSIHWRAITSSFMGMAAGYTINNYLNNLFIPALMRDFHWRSDQVALLSAAAVLSIICQPVAGRLTDRFGVRPVALFGTVTGAAVFLGFSVMTGAFWVYALLVTAQIALVASTTAAVVYSRPVAQAFSSARGLALALAICAPSIAGALLVPPLTAFFDIHGWRAGYHLVAAATLLVGLIAVWLASPLREAQAGFKQAVEFATPQEPTIRTILANPDFRLILTGMALCSLSITFQTTQLKVAMLDAGVNSVEASSFIAIYAMGVIGGRLVSGLALDFLPARWVAGVAMTVPGLGLLTLASGTTNPALLCMAMISIGFALGAEGDIAGYLVVSYLPGRIYSLAYGILIGTISLAAGMGGLLLCALLAGWGSVTAFLWIVGIAAVLGGSLFTCLRPTSHS